MIGSWAIQSALTKGKALSKGQCSRKALQSHFSSMQMDFKQGTAYYAGIGFSTSCTGVVKRVLSLKKGSYTSHSWQKSWSLTKR